LVSRGRAGFLTDGRPHTGDRPRRERSGQVGRKILQDAANTLPHMITSERLGHGDLETLAGLPDGTIAIDLLTCEARRDDVPVSLEIVQLLTEWLTDRLGRHGGALCDLAEARMELELRTDALPPTAPARSRLTGRARVALQRATARSRPVEPAGACGTTATDERRRRYGPRAVTRRKIA
jgi:hypothetical protein